MLLNATQERLFTRDHSTGTELRSQPGIAKMRVCTAKKERGR